MKTIKAAVISNGIEGLQKYFNSSKVIEYTFLEITKKKFRSVMNLATGFWYGHRQDK